jgi:hypothetical protein
MDRKMKPMGWIVSLAMWIAALGICVGASAQPASDRAAVLRAVHEELSGKLDNNDFGRPLTLSSQENNSRLSGDVYAVVNHPFGTVVSGLRDAAGWCDVLILPFNTKQCVVAKEGERTELRLRIGRKADQPVEDAYPLSLHYRVTASRPDYLAIDLDAPDGPLGTRDYSVSLEATPLSDTLTFIHLGYAYGIGAMSRLAMQVYLSTVGAGKVGFTVTDHDSQGKPVFVGGLLGATERNTMRHFLAIDVYLSSLAIPPPDRLAWRIDDWFAAAEKYPRQLHEMERDEYVAMKQKEAPRPDSVL